MKMIVILCSKVMLLSVHVGAWELLIKFEATRTGAPPPPLTVATSINNNIINTCIYRNQENSFRP